ncbi:MAG: DNA polymerase III subunit delta [Thalassotalea sp.]|nr:DNA polymerase III subunit delta [Thalassotalea sp.]MDG2393448.1 DNA polymerase III subunit delta [Thalassotalea sp.]
MRIYHSNINNQLAKPLLPVWLIFGDEPWQKNNGLDSIKQSAKQQGFDELIRFTADDKFDWNLVLQEYQSLSLFSALRIIEIDLVNNKVDDKATKVLLEISSQIQQQPQSDVLLILHGPKLEGAASRKKWFKELDKVGCYIPLYEMEGKGLNIWLNQQCQQLKLKLDSQAQSMLAEFFTGNLPALHQELQKLAILFDQQFIRVEDLESLLIKQAKFTPFQLIDALLAGDLFKCMNMLTQLKNEGIAAAQLVWVLHKELTQLETMQSRLNNGENNEALFKEYRVWDKRKPLYNKALNSMTLANLKLAKQRLAQADLVSKTSSDFDHYLLLSDVCITAFHGNITKTMPLNYEHLA